MVTRYDRSSECCPYYQQWQGQTNRAVVPNFLPNGITSKEQSHGDIGAGCVENGTWLTKADMHFLTSHQIQDDAAILDILLLMYIDRVVCARTWFISAFGLLALDDFSHVEQGCSMMHTSGFCE